MAESLEPLWAAMESVDPTLMPDGWRRLEPNVRDALVTSGIFVRGDPVERVRCPVCTPSHFEPVIARTGKDGSIEHFIKCPREMRVRVHADDLQTWRAEVGAVARKLAESAALVGDVRSLGGDRIWHCGHLVVRGVRVEVLLVRGLCRADGASVAASIPRSPLQRLVLVPSGVPDLTVWGSHVPMVLPLRSIANIDGDTISIDRDVITHAAQRLLRDGLVAPNLFHRRGENWDIGFDGGEVLSFTDSVGIAYIARLLSEPNVQIPAVTLLASRAGIDPRIPSGSSGSAIDDRGRTELRAEYQDLMKELVEARAMNDVARIQALEVRVERLTQELANRLGIGGRAREATDAERVRKSVSMAVSRDIDRIADKLPELGRHLRTTVSAGLFFSYAPESDPEWVT